MSGLKLVPRMPKWPSATKGSEAAASARTATGAPARSASPPPSTRPRRKSTAATVSSSTAIAEIVPCPGSRTVPQQTAQSSASPTAGDSQDHRRRPQSAIAACPIASEAAHTASTAA